MDNNGLKVNLFDFPLEVQYVRLVPIICHRGCTLRFELLGCELNDELQEVQEGGGEVVGGWVSKAQGSSFNTYQPVCL